jgi:hypothetical protein
MELGVDGLGDLNVTIYKHPTFINRRITLTYNRVNLFTQFGNLI